MFNNRHVNSVWNGGGNSSKFWSVYIKSNNSNVIWGRLQGRREESTSPGHNNEDWKRMSIGRRWNLTDKQNPFVQLSAISNLHSFSCLARNQINTNSHGFLWIAEKTIEASSQPEFREFRRQGRYLGQAVYIESTIKKAHPNNWNTNSVTRV